MQTNLPDAIPPERQAEIAEIVTAITETGPTEAIILYGSYARGDFVEDNFYQKDGVTHRYQSDYDFLIIVKHQWLKRSQGLFSDVESRFISRKPFHTAVSFIIDSDVFVNQQLRSGNQFYINIKNEGIELYRNKGYTMAEPHQLSSEEQLVVDRERYGYWMDRGKRFEEYQKQAQEKDNLNDSAFFLHQWGEALLNALLLTFRIYDPHTHNFKRLINMSVRADPRFAHVFPRTTKEDRKRFKLLVRAYTDARYDPSYSITKEELTILAENVAELGTLVREVCEEKLQLG